MHRMHHHVRTCPVCKKKFRVPSYSGTRFCSRECSRQGQGPRGAQDFYAKTHAEIGRELGISREGVRQIEIRALRKLKAALEIRAERRVEDAARQARRKKLVRVIDGGKDA